MRGTASSAWDGPRPETADSRGDRFLGSIGHAAGRALVPKRSRGRREAGGLGNNRPTIGFVSQKGICRHPLAPHASRLTPAFTLIELLVVIAIIAIIAAILFPVFAQAREKARQATCASNERNLATGVLLYAQDYDEALPLTAYGTTDDNFLAWIDLLDPYLKNKQVWLCPSSQVKPTDAGGRPTTDYGYNALYLTTINLAFSNVSAQSAVTLAAISHPAETVLLTDAKASKTNSWCGDDGKYLLPPSAINSDCWGRPNPLHAEGANVAWLDGHVKWYLPTAYYTGQQPIDRYFAPQ